MKKALLIAWIALTILWALIAVANIVEREPFIRIAYSITGTLFCGLTSYTVYNEIKRG